MTADVATQIDELKRFCWILATALALALAAIGYLFATSGLHERSISGMTNLVVRSDFEALKGRISVVERATGQLDNLASDAQRQLSGLSDKVERGNFVRNNLKIGEFSNGTFLSMTGPGGKSSLQWSFDSGGDPDFTMIGSGGKSSLRMSFDAAGAPTFTMTGSGGNSSLQMLFDAAGAPAFTMTGSGRTFSLRFDSGGDPAFTMTGSAGKFSLGFGTAGDPFFNLMDKGGTARLSMARAGASRAGQFCFFAFSPGADSTSRLLCDQP